MSLRGPLPDVEIPEVSLYEYLFGGLTEAELDLVGIEQPLTNQVLTYRQIRDDVDHIAAWFISQGIGEGDVVALALPTCPEYITAFHGIVRAGAAAAPMNVQYSAHEFADQMSKTHAKYVVLHAALAAQVQPAIAMVGMSPKNVIVVGAPPGAAEALGCVAFSTLTSCLAPLPPENIDPATHVASMPMSSGIGGLQKPVMLSHRNLVADLAMLMPIVGQREGGVEREVLVSFLPFSHVYATTGTMNFALLGRHLVVTMPQFDPATYLANIQKYKGTVLNIVPAVSTLLANDPMVDDYDLSSVRLIICGAAPLSEEVGDRLAKRLGAVILQGYGMTELSPVSHVMQPNMPNVSCETIGPAAPNVEFRVVDPATGQDVVVPEGTQESEPGEMWVKGPNVMLGYFERPEETAAIMTPDGYLNTGDLVRVDGRGVVRIVGRTKELIKNKGFQVAPAELEEVLRKHPAVADAAVFGVPLGDGGDEAPYALIVLKEGATATPIEMIKHVSSQVAKYKFLRSVTFVPSIPRDEDGLIDRASLPGLVLGAS